MEGNVQVRPDTPKVFRARNNFSALSLYLQNEGSYLDLWEALGRPKWRGLAAEAAWGIENVMGKEHGYLEEHFSLTEAQKLAIVPILGKLKLWQGLKLRGGRYDVLLMPGAKFPAMTRRTRRALDRMQHLDRRHRAQFGLIVGLWGQRPREDHIDGKVSEIYAALSGKVRSNGWVINQMKLQNGTDTYPMWEGPFATEFELGILSLIIATDGEVQIEGYELNKDTNTLPNIPVRKYLSCRLRLADGTKILALNAPAVERPKGPPRPTSISSTLHWLEHYSPKPDATVVSMPVRVHAFRVTRDLQAQIQAKFPGIEVFGDSEEVDDPMSLFNQALVEAVILLQKAYEELVACLALTIG